MNTNYIIHLKSGWLIVDSFFDHIWGGMQISWGEMQMSWGRMQMSWGERIVDWLCIS
jgi:hypothetical protein